MDAKEKYVLKIFLALFLFNSNMRITDGIAADIQDDVDSHNMCAPQHKISNYCK